MARSKYKKLTDLYVEGIELVLAEDTVMWLQCMNPFEVEEARKAAQTAAARYILAMKEIGSPEYDQVKASVLGKGEQAAIDDLVDNKQGDFFLKATNDIEVDDDWKERVEILRRADDIDTLQDDDPERELIAKVNAEWYTELVNRVTEDQDHYRELLGRMDFDGLLLEYTDAWMERRGNEKAQASYAYTEIFYATRVCDAVPDEAGEFTKASHIDCKGHKERVYESVEEVRELPQPLYDAIRMQLEHLQMGVREAGNSPRLLSSSESSQQPRPEGESTPSIPVETSQPVPGT